MAGRKSSSKGARGEREYKSLLEKCGASDAKRTGSAQRSGSQNFPDITHEGFSCEVKYRNYLSLKNVVDAVHQAGLSSKEGQTPYAAIRITNSPRDISGWFVFMLDADFINLAGSDGIIKSSEKRLPKLLRKVKTLNGKSEIAVVFEFNKIFYAATTHDIFCDVILKK